MAGQLDNGENGSIPLIAASSVKAVNEGKRGKKGGREKKEGEREESHRK